MPYAIEAFNLWKYFKVRKGGVLRRRYEVVEALRGVSLHVDWGEVYCLLGPNGAGKTTTVRIITTLLLPDKGWVRVAGFDCVRDAVKARSMMGVMLSVERGFFWKLTGRENLKYFGLLYGLDSHVLEERVEELLDMTGLKELGGDEKRFEDMSLGMRARLGIARVLLRDPQVLILDEPTLGLDPVSARMIRSILRSQANDGKAVLVTTHNMFEAERICDRVGIIVDGRIVIEGRVPELKSIVKRRVPLLIMVKGDREVVERIANELGGLLDTWDDKFRIRLLADPGSEYDVLERAIRTARSYDVRVLEARVEEPTLEDVFIEVAGGEKWR